MTNEFEKDVYENCKISETFLTAYLLKIKETGQKNITGFPSKNMVH